MKIRIEARDKKAIQLLQGAVKWLRRIEERRDDLPSTFFHGGVDPKPLRELIEEYLAK